MKDDLNIWSFGPWKKFEYEFFKLKGFYTGTTV